MLFSRLSKLLSFLLDLNMEKNGTKLNVLIFVKKKKKSHIYQYKQEVSSRCPIICKVIEPIRKAITQLYKNVHLNSTSVVKLS